MTPPALKLYGKAWSADGGCVQKNSRIACVLRFRARAIGQRPSRRGGVQDTAVAPNGIQWVAEVATGRWFVLLFASSRKHPGILPTIYIRT